MSCDLAFFSFLLIFYFFSIRFFYWHVLGGVFRDFSHTQVVEVFEARQAVDHDSDVVFAEKTDLEIGQAWHDLLDELAHLFEILKRVIWNVKA